MKSNKKFYIICSFVILPVLLGIFYPCLSFPPISDSWEMLYSFHHLDELPGLVKSLHLLNFDIFEQVGHRPLAHTFYYIIHLVFGSSFMFVNIFNFFLYFLSIILLYRMSLFFVKNRVFAAMFVGFFAFLFNHSVIIIWPGHTFIILGFCLFLLGFMRYIKFLKTDKPFLLFSIIPIFLIGMWCYESFFLWPLAIIIISSIKSLRGESYLTRKKVVRRNWLVLGIVYPVYFLFYLFTKSLGTYGMPVHKISDFLKLTNFISSGLLSFFNILYNSIAVNIYPLLAFPLNIRENIYMSGPVIKYIKTNPEVILIEGILIVVALFWFFFSLYRKKYFEEIKIIGLFLFLIISETFIVFFGKLSISNSLTYCLSEFRYQYIPNAFFILIVLYTINRFIKPSKNKRKIIYLVLALICALNIYCSRKVVNIYSSHLTNLGKMISSIRLSISRGLINEDDKLYIDKDMPDYFPGLCWNIEMGERFIEKGNYQWMFSKKEIKYFSEDINGADWIIDKEKFNVVEKTAENIRKKGTKVILGKIEQYEELEYFYMEGNDYGKAETMFKKVIELDSKNCNAYEGLRDCYRRQGRYKEAEEMHRKAAKIRAGCDDNSLRSIVF